MGPRARRWLAVAVLGTAPIVTPTSVGAAPAQLVDPAHPGTPDVEHDPGLPVYDPASAAGTVYRTYRGYLGREPDEAGFRHWMAAHAAGLDVVAIVHAIATSDELLSRDMDPMVRAAPRFVDWAYVTVLGRAPEPAGLDWWLRLMGEGMSRAEVLAHIADSAEHRAATDGGTPPGYRPG